MKKIVVLVSIVFLLFSCGGASTVKKELKKTPIKHEKKEKKVVVERDEELVKKDFEKVMNSYKEDDLSESYIKGLSNISSNYAKYPYIAYDLAYLYMLEKNYQKSYEYLNKSLKGNYFTPALTNIAYMAYKLNKEKEVLNNLKTFFSEKFDMRSNDENVRNRKELALSNFALIVILTGTPEESIDYIRKILTVKPKSVHAYKAMAYAYINMKKWSLAKKVIDLAISYSEKNETKADLYVIKGWIYEGEGRSAEMVASYKKALELDKTNINAVLSISILLMKYGAGVEAVPYLKVLIDKYSENVIFLNLYAISLRMAGKYDDAAKEYDKIIKLKPNFVNAYYNKAFLLQKYKEDPKGAITLYEKYKSLGGKKDVSENIKVAKQLLKDLEEMRKEEAAEKAAEKK